MHGLASFGADVQITGCIGIGGRVVTAWSEGLGRQRGFLAVVTSTLGPTGHYGFAGRGVSIADMVGMDQGEVHVIPDSRDACVALAKGGGGSDGRHG